MRRRLLDAGFGVLVGLLEGDHLLDGRVAHVRLGHREGPEHAAGVDEELAEDGEDERRVEDRAEGQHARQPV